ncbi:MAG: 50S ribosomal protein L3 N(5)-glutamine methyltransferase [Pseudomonadota bacterium]
MVATRDEHSNLLGDAPATIGAAIERVCDGFEFCDLSYGHGSDNAWDEAVFLVLAASGLPLDADSSAAAQLLSDEQWARICGWYQRRVVERKPLPYLMGRAWFAGIEFLCDERALVPRSPLAEVIQNQYAPWWQSGSPQTLLDLCCGGGCIGIAAALYGESLDVVLADVDRNALALAQENVERHQLNHRVSTAQSDLWSSLGGQRFDIILSNPPYVDASDLASMPAEYHAEPPIGLGSGPDGLDASRIILKGAVQFLNPSGLLFLEVGNSWEALDKLLASAAPTWLELEGGGHGVMVVRAEELPAIAELL